MRWASHPDEVVNMERDKEWVAVCRRQRAAYSAWQADPLGNSGAAFQEYLTASKAWADFFKTTKPTAKQS